MVKASGEEALAIALTDFAIEEHPVRVLAIKRHLQRLIGQPRFRQRLEAWLPDDMLQMALYVKYPDGVFLNGKISKSDGEGFLPRRLG